MSESPNHAFVIQIDSRFFCRFGKHGRLQTAWCLAGARLFRSDCTGADEVLARLNRKGVKYSLKVVAMNRVSTASDN